MALSLFLALASACGELSENDSPSGSSGTTPTPTTTDPTSTPTSTEPTPTPTSTPSLAPNEHSLSFDGADDYIRIAGDASLGGFSAFTLEAWVRPSSGGPERTIFGKWAGSSGLEYGMVQRASGYTNVGGAAEMDWSNGLDTYFLAGPSGSLPVGQWSHIAATWAGGSGTRVFVNGQLVATGTTGVSPANTLNDLLIGAFNPGGQPSGFFHGSIDEVRLWVVARTQAEVQSTMEETLAGNEPGLRGYWNFEEASGDSVLDLTSHENDGRLGNGNGPDASDPTWSLETPF